MSVRLHAPGSFVPGIHWLGGWVGSRLNVNLFETGRFPDIWDAVIKGFTV